MLWVPRFTRVGERSLNLRTEKNYPPFFFRRGAASVEKIETATVGAVGFRSIAKATAPATVPRGIILYRCPCSSSVVLTNLRH